MQGSRQSLKSRDDIFAINPRIVYARGSGQGTRGPDAEAGGNDGVSFWSRAGVAFMLSDPDGDEPIPQRPAIGEDLPIAGVHLVQHGPREVAA